MRTISLILLVMGACLLVHCNEDCGCDPGPFFGELKVKVTINNENPEVWLNVFEGKVEDGDTIISEMVSESRVYYELEADKYYSATASYAKGARQIIAINGKKMDVVTDSDDCECESAEDITLNLRLAD